MTWFIRRVARRLSLIEQVLPENPRPPCFSGVRAAQSLIFFAMFWWSFWLFSIGHCIVCLCFFDFSLLITPLVSSNCSYDDLWCDPIPRILGSWMHNMFVDGGDADNENKGKSPFLFDSGCKQKVYVQINKYINILICWRPV